MKVPEWQISDAQLESLLTTLAESGFYFLPEVHGILADLKAARDYIKALPQHTITIFPAAAATATNSVNWTSYKRAEEDEIFGGPWKGHPAGG